MKKRIIILALLIFTSVIVSLGQNPPPPPTPGGGMDELGGPVGVPIDGGALGLIAIGLGLTIRKMLKKKKMVEN